MHGTFRLRQRCVRPSKQVREPVLEPVCIAQREPIGKPERVAVGRDGGAHGVSDRESERFAFDITFGKPIGVSEYEPIGVSEFKSVEIAEREPEFFAIGVAQREPVRVAVGLAQREPVGESFDLAQREPLGFAQLVAVGVPKCEPQHKSERAPKFCAFRESFLVAVHVTYSDGGMLDSSALRARWAHELDCDVLPKGRPYV